MQQHTAYSCAWCNMHYNGYIFQNLIFKCDFILFGIVRTAFNHFGWLTKDLKLNYFFDISDGMNIDCLVIKTKWSNRACVFICMWLILHTFLCDEWSECHWRHCHKYLFALQFTENDEIKYNIQMNCGAKSAESKYQTPWMLSRIFFNVYDVPLFFGFSFSFTQFLDKKCSMVGLCR